LPERSSLNFLFGPLGLAGPTGYMFSRCFLLLTISFRPITSTSAGTIFANFAGSIKLSLQMIYLKLVFSIPQGTLPWHLVFVGFIHRIEFRRHSVDGVSVRYEVQLFAGHGRLLAQPGGLNIGL